MEYVRLPGAPPDAAVGFTGEAERTLYYLHFLAVVGIQVTLQKRLEFRFYKPVFLFGRHWCFGVHIHNGGDYT